MLINFSLEFINSNMRSLTCRWYRSKVRQAWKHAKLHNLLNANLINHCKSKGYRNIAIIFPKKIFVNLSIVSFIVFYTFPLLGENWMQMFTAAPTWIVFCEFLAKSLSKNYCMFSVLGRARDCVYNCRCSVSLFTFANLAEYVFPYLCELSSRTKKLSTSVIGANFKNS